MSSTDLRLLCLDGGGVRGLSSLLILKQLMEEIATDPFNPPRPCQYFHMIGGTSTGGIIAIMLGRLGMTVDECIAAYSDLFRGIFVQKHHRVTLSGTVRGRFDTKALEAGVKKHINKPETGLTSDTTLYDENDVSCKVFVCAASAKTRDTTVFTSYVSRDRASSLLLTTKIWEAARATSAASTFFEPIEIGPHKEPFVDGAFVANNPVKVMWEEARHVFGAEGLAERLRCVVSIGTGEPGVKPVGDKIRELLNTLKELATESDKTAMDFEREHDADLVRPQKYFRFNVTHGLEDVGLQEYKEEATIAGVTRSYLQREALRQVRSFVEHMQGSTFAQTTSEDPASVLSPTPEDHTVIPVHRNSEPARRREVGLPQEQFLFHVLTRSPKYLDSNQSYPWRKLTLAGWEVYHRMFDAMKKNEQNRVSMSDFKSQIPTGPLRGIVAMYWPILDRALPHYKLPRPYAMALLFMLHLRVSIDCQMSAISPDRLFSLRRFAEWVDCDCGCGREWNFANDLGMARKRVQVDQRACLVVRYNEAGRFGRLAHGEGKKRNEENRRAWQATKPC